MEKKIREEGTCPYCGGNNIDWHGSELDNEFMFYGATCCDCNRDFVEVFKLTYDGYNTYDNDGEHCFDKDGNEL